MKVKVFEEAPSQEDLDEKLIYFKDQRTDLCFARITSFTKDGWHVASITNVPCDKVSHLIK